VFCLQHRNVCCFSFLKLLFRPRRTDLVERAVAGGHVLAIGVMSVLHGKLLVRNPFANGIGLPRKGGANQKGETADKGVFEALEEFPALRVVGQNGGKGRRLVKLARCGMEPLLETGRKVVLDQNATR